MSQCCSIDSLAKLLEHQLDSAREATVIAHLSDCSSCRDRLEALTADLDFWQDVGVQLKPFNDAQPAIEVKEELGSRQASEDQLRTAIESRSPDGNSPESNSSRSNLSHSNSPESRAAADHVAAIHFVKQLLTPTDDPASLGRLGVYEITGIIGVGGMGIVLKGLDASLHRSVAIKILAAHLTTNGAARQRFAREAQAAASVVHENVMAIHAIDQWQGVPYFVMPLVRGESLDKRLKRSGALDVLEILRVARQIAAGLAEAHQQGLVHRDIKPANILMEHGSERLKIADFGLARAGDDASLTRSGHILGTPLYMSPEQARGENVDTRSDIFSFGSLLYALSTGHPPFRAETPYGVIRRLCEEEPRPIQEYNPAIPFWLSGIVERMMSKQAENRFADTNELVELFTSGLVFLQQPAETQLPQPLLPYLKKSNSSLDSAHHRSPALAVALVTTAVVIAVSLLFAFTYVGWSAYISYIRLPPDVGQHAQSQNEKTSTAEASQPSDQDSLAAKDDSQDLGAGRSSPSSLIVDEPGSASTATADIQLAKEPVAQAAQASKTAQADRVADRVAYRVAYRFQLGERLRYSCELKLTRNSQLMVVAGTIDLQTIEVEDQHAELDYQINWNQYQKPNPDYTNTNTNATQERSDARTSVRQHLQGLPIYGGRPGPLDLMPHIPFGRENPFFSTDPIAFGFEIAEFQNCEIAGRAKIGVDGTLLGCSHRSELPGHLGRVLEWIFPTVGGAQGNRQWQVKTSGSLTIPKASNLDDWDQRQRIPVNRNSDFEVLHESGQEANMLYAQFVIADEELQRPKQESRSIQTLLGNLQFDMGTGKLAQLTVARSTLPSADENSSSQLQLREATLQIQQMGRP